ncbi:pyridoxamine 5'-phosphate oxidase family protein [Telmatobacter bradus]|uniref:pyridoxamine 5'-phosphate oxidase family protein n=1 Tax=Telmatobacter bradus TaxID=474953 RepID=UPI003B42D478
MKSSREQKKVLEFLKSESTMVLATRGEDGLPYAAPLFYVVDESFRFYWLSSRDSVHSLHLQSSPQASAAVFHSTFRWREIEGVQMRGVCSILDGPERSAILAEYCERFHLGTVLSLAARHSTLYCFQPQWVRMTENKIRLGRKIEFNL